jgi:hypothetical protein
MLLVLAGEHDLHARRLVAAWQEHGARLLTARDLSRPGWRLHVEDPGEDVAIVGAEPVPASALRGVITRLPSIWHADLLHVLEGDREYVAAEMTAFLSAFLTRLACPVVNRPSTVSLMGPSWTPERWIAAAARAGMKPPWMTRHYPPAPPAEPPTFLLPPGAVELVVLGDRCLGVAAPELKAQACRLATSAGAKLLAVNFSGPGPDAHFISAHLYPDVSQPEIAGALLDFFRRPTAPTT